MKNDVAKLAEVSYEHSGILTSFLDNHHGKSLSKLSFSQKSENRDSFCSDVSTSTTMSVFDANSENGKVGNYY